MGCARCVCGAGSASRDRAHDPRDRIAHLRVIYPSVRASDWLICGQKRLKAQRSIRTSDTLGYLGHEQYGTKLVCYCSPVVYTPLDCRLQPFLAAKRFGFWPLPLCNLTSRPCGGMLDGQGSTFWGICFTLTALVSARYRC